MPRRSHLLVLALLTAGCLKDLGSANSSTSDSGTTSDTTAGPTSSPTSDPTETGSSTTSDTTCGDGQIDPGEQCDDGNLTPGDGCEADCSTTPGELCGNKELDDGEECDDGNEIDIDACKNNCTLPVIDPKCGDGEVNAGEECDDGNEDSTDACTQFCKFAACGDGFVQDGEECDDGSTDDSGACLSSCVPAACGDGHLQVGSEECDNGDDNSDDAYDGCTTACMPGPSCGDMIVNGPEECDDGTPDGDDLCNACVDTPRRYIFVTADTFNGKHNGVGGADDRCGVAALDADLGPANADWVAWLSDGFGGAALRMDTGYTGWYATPGDLPIAKGWSELSSGMLLNPIMTETGAALAPGESTWTNTNTNGAILDLMQHCNGWTNNGGGNTGRLGDPSAVDSQWTDKAAPNTATCDSMHHIYCVEN